MTKLEKIVEEWLKDTSGVLDISGLGLKGWPDSLVGKEDLVVKLECSHNRLTSLPLFPKLTELWCDHNQLTSLPSFPKLTDLGCFNNQLTSLPPRLPNLIGLRCENNQLTSLPFLPKLTKLGCNNNQLTFLPLFPNLYYLRCFDNKLTSLPVFPNLTTLWCNNNKLVFLPLLPNLTKLWCHNSILFSIELTKWKRVWCLKALRNNEKRKRGLKRVVKVLKNRLYLPRLDALKQDLIYSPNHPGKFYKELRIGNWSSETKKTTKPTK